MAIDASIYNALQQPQRSAAEWADFYAGQQDKQQAREMNALLMTEQRAKLADAGRTRERTNALQSALQGLGAGATDDQRLGVYEQFGQFDAADKIRTGIINRKKAEADAAKTGSQVMDEALKRYRGSLDFIDTPQGAQRWLQAQYQDPATADYMARLAPFEQAVQRIPQDPAQFQQWRQQVGLGMEKHMQEMRARDAAAEVVRHNKSTEGLTARGQNMADARAREGLAQTQKRWEAERADRQSGGAGAATEDERKAAGWLSQAENAWANMQKVALGDAGPDGKRQIKDAATPGLMEQAMWFSETARNTARSADRQQFVQASGSLSEALLRAATGAGVNRDEAEQKVRELTPQWGDSEAVIRQKFDSVPTYIQSLKTRAGRAIPRQQGAQQGGGVVDFGSLK